MDCRNKKGFDFKTSEAHKANLKKNEIIQTKWLQRFEWVLDDYRLMEKELQNLRKGKQTASDVVTLQKDKRSIRPFPVTTSGEYGWLASKPEFRLEKPNDYIPKFPNPMDEVKLLKGNIPSLVPGIGLF